MKRSTVSDRSGFVTVPTAILLLIVCLFDLVLVDASSVVSGKYFYSKRVRNAAESILASYDSVLFSKYSLLGLNISQYTQIETDFLKYVSEPVRNSVISFSRMNRKDWDVSLLGALSEPDAMKEAITDVMKYKSIANGALYIAEALGILNDANNVSGAAADIARGEQKLALAKTRIKLLERKVEGVFKGDSNSVNGFSKWIPSFLVTSGSIFLKNFSLADIENAAPLIREGLEELHARLNLYLKLNTDAFDLIVELKKIASDVGRIAVKARAGLTDITDETVRNDLEKRIGKLESESVRISNDGLLEPLRNNVTVIGRKAAGIAENILAVESLSAGADSGTDVDRPGFDASGFADNIKNALKTDDVNCSLSVSKFYVSSDESLVDYDVRANDLSDLSIYSSDRFEIPSDVYRYLPSVRKGIKGSFADLFDSFESIDEVTEILSELADSFNASDFLTGALEKVLVCDYVSSYFSDVTSVSPYGIENTFLCEKEYVIGGHQLSDENVRAVTNKLLALRFLFNFMHCYCDETKHAFASEVGQAVAFVLSAGIGGEIYAFLLICAWSMAESYEDVRALRKGEKVVLVKTKETWKTSIKGLADAVSGGSGSGSGNDGNEKFGLNYSQYLILLMLLMPSESLLYRISDVIEVNMSDYVGTRYMLSGVFTGLRCSVKYVPVLISPFFIMMGKEKLSFEITETVSY